MFATKKKLIATLAVGSLAVGFASQASGAPAGHAELAKVEGASMEALRTKSREVNSTAAAAEAKKAQPKPAFAAPESFGVSQSALDAIASCESGGDPTAVSPDGTYRGKYQFDYGTWASMGGSGDPAAAPEAEQDMRAAELYSQAGSSPWPVCG